MRFEENENKDFSNDNTNSAAAALLAAAADKLDVQQPAAVAGQGTLAQGILNGFELQDRGRNHELRPQPLAPDAVSQVVSGVAQGLIDSLTPRYLPFDQTQPEYRIQPVREPGLGSLAAGTITALEKEKVTNSTDDRAGNFVTGLKDATKSAQDLMRLIRESETVELPPRERGPFQRMSERRENGSPAAQNTESESFGSKLIERLEMQMGNGHMGRDILKQYLDAQKWRGDFPKKSAQAT